MDIFLLADQILGMEWKKKRLKKREDAYKSIMLLFLLTGRLSNSQKVKIFPQRFLIEFPKTKHFYLGNEIVSRF